MIVNQNFQINDKEKKEKENNTGDVLNINYIDEEDLNNYVSKNFEESSGFVVFEDKDFEKMFFEGKK